MSEFVPEFRDQLKDPEEKLGAGILLKALRAPARLIAENAGVDGDVIVERLTGQPFEIGYNAVGACYRWLLPLASVVWLHCAGLHCSSMPGSHGLILQLPRFDVAAMWSLAASESDVQRWVGLLSTTDFGRALVCADD